MSTLEKIPGHLTLIFVITLMFLNVYQMQTVSWKQAAIMAKLIYIQQQNDKIISNLQEI